MNGMIRIYYSQRKILNYSCAISSFQWLWTSLLFLTEPGGTMETSAIALTDKVILELDSQVLSYVKLILLTVAYEYTIAS